MKHRNALGALILSVSLISPAFARAEWTSTVEKIDSVKETYETKVAEANTRKTQEIYLELDQIRGRDKNKFLTDLQQQPPRILSFVCQYLVSRKVIEAVPVLIRVYDRPNDREALYLPDSIVSTVARLDGIGNRKFLLRVLPSDNIWVRRSAVQALAALPYDRETLVGLRNALLSDRDAIVRREAALALGNFPHEAWAKQGLETAKADEQDVLQAIDTSLHKINQSTK